MGGRGGYRYATAPAINIAGKVDGERRVGGTVPGEGPEPGIYNETKKRYSVFLRRRFPPASIVAGFFLPRDARRSWLGCRRSSLYTDVQQSRPGPSGALLKIEDAIHLAGGPAAGPSK